MSASKDKGSGYERKIASMLSKRFLHIYNSEKSFITNSGSGARFGGKNASKLAVTSERHHLVGDITPPDNKFKFVIECKHYKSPVTFMSVVKGSLGQWDKWINQVDTDAKSSGKQPMLVVRYNLVPDIVILMDHVISSEDLVSIINYKNRKVYLLSDVLKLEDEFFIRKGE